MGYLVLLTSSPLSTGPPTSGFHSANMPSATTADLVPNSPERTHLLDLTLRNGESGGLCDHTCDHTCDTALTTVKKRTCREANSGTSNSEEADCSGTEEALIGGVKTVRPGLRRWLHPIVAGRHHRWSWTIMTEQSRFLVGPPAHCWPAD